MKAFQIALIGWIKASLPKKATLLIITFCMTRQWTNWLYLISLFSKIYDDYLA